MNARPAGGLARQEGGQTVARVDEKDGLSHSSTVCFDVTHHSKRQP
jgi:hypothetical protein